VADDGKRDSAALQKAAKEEAYRREVVKMIFGNAGLILSDFSCAVESKMTLHGRMYVTTRFICFYSNFFGYEKKIILPYRSINCISKTNDSVFVSPGVEISTARQVYVFRNFWDRDEAFKILRDCHRAGLGEPHLPDSVVPSLVKQIRSSQAARRAAQQEMRRRQTADEDSIRAGSPDKSAKPRRRTSSEDRDADRSRRAASEDIKDAEKTRDAGKDKDEAASEADGSENGAQATLRSGTPTMAIEPGEGEDEEIVDEEQVPKGEEGKVDPELSSQNLFQMARENRKLEYTLVTDKFSKMTLDDFWSHFLADGAAFSLPKFHIERGDTEMETGPWAGGVGGLAQAKEDPRVPDGMADGLEEAQKEVVGQPDSAALSAGLVRSVKFRTPVHGPIGPSSTRAVKVQRIRRFGDVGLIVDSSTSLEDIPMSETFTVEDSWAVEQTPGGDLSFEITFEVKFHKSNMLKSLVASKSKADTQKFYEDWTNAAKRYWHYIRYPKTERRSPMSPKKPRTVMKEAKPKPKPKLARVEPRFSIPVIPWLLAIIFAYLYLFGKDPPTMQPGLSTDETAQMLQLLGDVRTRLDRIEQTLDELLDSDLQDGRSR